MKEIILSGVFGWEITPDYVRSQLDQAKGEDVEIVLASVGGDVFDGNDIYNQVSDYRRKNPDSQISLRMSGVVASMAAYLAMNPSFDLVSAEDNAAFMVHNVWTMAVGDHREMLRVADMLHGLSAPIMKRVASRMGITESEAQKIMDDETWFFGQQIVDAGFADGIVDRPSGASDRDKSSAIAEIRSIHDKILKKAYENRALKVAASATFPIATVGSYDSGIDIIDETWSQSDADKRWRAHTGAEDEPNAKYRQAFMWYDSENIQNFTAYKLQVKDYRNGREVVNIRAVNNASARLSQVRGPTSDEKNRIQAIIDKYQARWKREQENSSMDENQIKADAVASERERVKTLNEIKAKYSETPSAKIVSEIVDKAIEEGTSKAEVLTDLVLTVNNGNTLAALDSPPFVGQGDAETVSGEAGNGRPEEFDYAVW